MSELHFDWPFAGAAVGVIMLAALLVRPRWRDPAWLALAINVANGLVPLAIGRAFTSAAASRPSRGDTGP